MYLNDKIFAV